VFAVVAVVTLALGIGANSAIFSVVNGVLLRPLPYEQPDELVNVWTYWPRDPDPQFVSAAEYLDYRAAATAFADMGAVGANSVTITGDGDADRRIAAFATRTLFDVLGAQAAVGRLYTHDEDQDGAPLVAVLSHGYWVSHFGADPSVFGRNSITADGRDYLIVGAMGPRFDPLGLAPALYLPPQYDRGQITDRSGHGLTVIGRLSPSATLASANAELQALLGRWEREFAGQHTTNTTLHTMSLVPFEDQVFGDVRGLMWVLLAAVGLVLLLACANVANLLLARGESRMKEIGVRTALGAGRWRIVRQLLTESLILALAGGAVGLVIGRLGVPALLALEPGNLPRVNEVTVDWNVVLFTTGVSVFTGLLFGMAPAWKAGRGDVTQRLHEGGRSGSVGRDTRRLLGSLVVFQVALAVVLLVGSGLLIKSFFLLTRVDPGFQPESRVAFRVSLSPGEYEGRDAAMRFYDALLPQVEALPGVTRVAAARGIPLRSAIFTEGFLVEGQPLVQGEPNPSAEYQSVTPAYFGLMGIPVLRGREFESGDRIDAQAVALLNAAAAEAYFPGENPVGRRILPLFASQAGVWYTIVGVVGDVRHRGLEQEPRPELYLPHAQARGFGEAAVRSSDIVLATTAEPAQLAGPIRDIVRRLDRDVPVTNLATLETSVSDTLSAPRFVMVLYGVFAALALLIAAVGVYGVMAFSVARRTKEIGIRLALGAAPAQVVRTVVGGAFALAALGTAIGLGTAFLATRALESMVFGVSVRDVSVFAIGAVLLLATAVSAAFMPARKASAVDPAMTLQSE
jgi:putative ABC transport system permease protein